MQIENGKLYEARNGQRFRVTQRADGHFECCSYTSVWNKEGLTVLSGYDLIREVEQYRWIPVLGNTDNLKEGDIYRYRRGHVQRRVTREEAQRLAPNYQEKTLTAAIETALPEAKLVLVTVGNIVYYSLTLPNGVNMMVKA